MRFRTGNVPTTVTRGRGSKSPYCLIRVRIRLQVHRLTLSMKMGSGAFGTLPLGCTRGAVPGPPILQKAMRSIFMLCCGVSGHDRRHQGQFQRQGGTLLHYQAAGPLDMAKSGVQIHGYGFSRIYNPCI
jgi:hypothetical protein